jgi:hypothetical protein
MGQRFAVMNLKIGKKGEISGMGKVAPGGAKLFRERLPQIQAEAAYWENAGWHTARLPWLDQILGVWDGFRGTKDRKSVEELLGFAFEADLFYVANLLVTSPKCGG